MRFSYILAGGPARLFYVGPEVSFASGYGSDWYPALSDGVRSTGVLTVHAPAGELTISEGEGTAIAPGVMRFQIDHATYFSFFTGRFREVDHPGQVPLKAYLLRHEPLNPAFLPGIERMVRILSDVFGPFPLQRLQIVEIPREIAQQASFNGFAVPGILALNHRALDAPDPKYIDEFVGHEIAHQWFPHAVALDTPPGLYMEEALAEYGGMRVVEAVSGRDVARQFRINGNPFDPVYGAAQYAQLLRTGCDQPLGSLSRGLQQRNLAYTKGFLVWNALAEEIGRERFASAMTAIVRKHRYGTITWLRFLAEIEQRSGRNLRPVFEQWFGRMGLPSWSWSWNQKGRMLVGELRQSPPYYRASLDLVIHGSAKQSMTQRVALQPRTITRVSLHVPFRATSAVIDPEYQVPHWSDAVPRPTNIKLCA